jgi:hypothetical protein
MKTLKSISALLILLIGIFSFTSFEKSTPISNLNLDEVDVIQMLSEQEYECRPSSEVMFFVETGLVKKSRGSSTINTSVYVLDRVSGKSKLLANENIIVPTHKDTFLHYDTAISNCEKIELSNGDKTLGSNINAPYCFNELIKYKTIYKSFVRYYNKLLNRDRTL